MFRTFARKLSAQAGPGPGPQEAFGASQQAKAVGIGAFAGMFGSLVGMGGSFVALPMLTGILNLGQHTAHGTSMAAVLFTSSGGILAFSKFKGEEGSHEKVSFTLFDRQIDIPVKVGGIHIPAALCIASAGSATALFGAWLNKRLSARALKISVGIFQLCMVPVAPGREYIVDYFKGEKQKKVEAPRVSTPGLGSKVAEDGSNVGATPIPKHQHSDSLSTSSALQLVGMGSAAGVLAGLFGVGGGAIVVPALLVMTDVDHKTALGTSLAAMFPTAISGSIAHYRQGTMLVKCSIPLGIGCVCGSLMGGEVVKVLDEETLKYCFSAMMFVLGGKQLMAGLKMVK